MSPNEDDHGDHVNHALVAMLIDNQIEKREGSLGKLVLCHASH